MAAIAPPPARRRHRCAAALLLVAALCAAAAATTTAADSDAAAPDAAQRTRTRPTMMTSILSAIRTYFFSSSTTSFAHHYYAHSSSSSPARTYSRSHLHTHTHTHTHTDSFGDRYYYPPHGNDHDRDRDRDRDGGNAAALFRARRVPPTLCRSGCLRFPRFSATACPRAHCKFVSCRYTAVGRRFRGHICIRKRRAFPGCNTPCQKWWTVASAHCERATCRVAQCRIPNGQPNGGEVGWQCLRKGTATATPPPPPFPPTTMAPVTTGPRPPPGDPSKCYKKCFRLEKDARNGCDDRICRVVQCPFDNVDRGFACRPLARPPPRPCSGVCFVAKSPAAVKAADCSRAQCKLVPCLADKNENRKGFRCVNKPSR